MQVKNSKFTKIILRTGVGAAFGLALCGAQAAELPVPQYAGPSTAYVFPAAFKQFDLTAVASNTAPHASAPQISEWTRSNGPGDTMVLTGEALSARTGTEVGRDTLFSFYGQGGSTQAQGVGAIQRLDGQQCAVTLPANLPDDEMYLMWPRNENGYGKPVGINRAEAWWIGFDDTINRGGDFSVYGRDLILSGSVSYLYIEELDRWLTSVSANPYKTDFVLPNDVANGTYTVWAHNGHGREFGWSKSQTLTVENTQVWNGTTINVKNYGAKGDGSADDRQAIANAISACPANGTVYFPAGTYLIGAKLTSIGSNKRLMGDGPGQSIIRARAGYTAGNAEYGMIQSAMYNVEVRDLGFEAGAYCDGKVVNCEYSQKLSFINCRFSQLGNGTSKNVVDAENSKRIAFIDCDFILRTLLFAGNANKALFDGCNFYGLNDTGQLLNIGGADNISIIDCTGQNYDNSDWTDGSTWCQGRFIHGTGNMGTIANAYIGENSTTDLYPRYNFDEHRWSGLQQPHLNTGEQIMFEGQHTVYRGKVLSATASSVRCEGLTANYTSLILTIVDGRGFGQSRFINAVDTGNGNVTLAEPWLVEPDATSTVMIGKYVYQMTVHNNYLDGGRQCYVRGSYDYEPETYVDTASCGISFYGSHIQCVVANNTLHELEGGMLNWSIPLAVDNGSGTRLAMPNYFNQYCDNNVDGVMYGMGDMVYGASLGTFIEDVAILGTVWRGNTFSNVTDTVVISNSDHPGAIIETCVLDHNTANTLLKGNYAATGPENQIWIGNTFTGSGSQSAISFINNYVPVLRDNTWNGFGSAYSGTRPGPALEVPVRVIEVNDGSGATTVEVRNSGTDTLNWSATTSSDWLNITGGSGAIGSEQGSEALTFEVTKVPAAGSEEAIIEVTGDGEVQQMTVIYNAAAVAPPPPDGPPAPVLTSITVSGPSSVDEESSAQYTCTASYSDSSSATVDPAWSEDSAYASIDSAGLLTTADVAADETVTVTATYEGLSSSVDVTINYVPPVLERIEISGPASVQEGTTATYSCVAHYSDGSVLGINPAWSDNSASATISSSGLFTANDVASDVNVTVTASFGGKTDTHAVTITYVPPTLTGLTILGALSLNEETSEQYSCVGSYSDGSTATVSPVWSENSSFASISSSGLLTVGDVSSDQTVLITASLDGVNASQSVTINYVAPYITGIEILGVDVIDEESTTQYTCESISSDGSRSAISPTWSVSAGTATIDAAGVLTAGNVTADEVATIEATFDGKTDTFELNIRYVAPVITGLSISGPLVLEEGSTASYTCTASYSDGTSSVVTPVWSESSSYASINAAGLLSAGDVASDQSVSITADFGGVQANYTVTILYVAPPVSITGISIGAPSVLNENSTETLSCTAIYSDGSTVAVNPAWSTDSSVASIDASGLLSVGNIDVDSVVTVGASYNGLVASHSINIWAIGNQVIYPLTGFEGKTVKASLWDETAQEWIELGEMVSPEELVVENVTADQWYKVAVEEWNSTTGEWDLVHTSWISM
jgi:hypothetical protein